MQLWRVHEILALALIDGSRYTYSRQIIHHLHTSSESHSVSPSIPPHSPSSPISPETWSQETGGWRDDLSRAGENLPRLNALHDGRLRTEASSFCYTPSLSWSACGYAPRGCGPSQLAAELAWVTGTVTWTHTWRGACVCFPRDS